MNSSSKREESKSIPKSSKSTPKLEVGDELAFEMASSWRIFRITHISPTGRIKAGPFMLNPDLSIRGKRDSLKVPSYASLVTQEIQIAIFRSKTIQLLNKTEWDRLSDDTLYQIRQIVLKATQS